MQHMDFAIIDAARQTLGLDVHATLDEVHAAYKHLAAEWHPDRHGGSAEAEERFKQVTHAHDILVEFCGRYCFSFKEPDVKRSLMDPAFRAHLKRYYDGQYGQLDI